MSKKFYTSKILKHILTAGVFIFFGYLLFKYQKDLYIVQNISPLQFITISLLILIGIALNGSKLNRIASSFGVRLQTSEWLALSSMTTELNNLFFKAGSVAISGYLKKKYDFPYLFFAGTFLGDQLIMLFVSSLMGSGVSLYLELFRHQNLLPIVIGFALISALLFLLMSGDVGVPQKKNAFFDLLKNGIESFNTLFLDKKLMCFLGLHNIFLIATIGLRFYVTCSILNLEIPLSHCFLFATAMIFVRVLPITHSDIGIREITIGFLSDIMGNGLKAGILATAVDRIFELLWTTLCTGIFRSALVTPKIKKLVI